MGREDYAARSLDAITYIVIHHSAVDVDSTPLSIAKYHVESLKWPGIGYHWVVGWDGTISYVGDVQTSRANVYGRNREVVGICLPGNWTERVPPDPQLAATRELVRWLLGELPGRVVVGHYEVALPVSPTSCPGAFWPQWRNRII